MHTKKQFTSAAKSAAAASADTLCQPPYDEVLLEELDMVSVRFFFVRPVLVDGGGRLVTVSE